MAGSIEFAGPVDRKRLHKLLVSRGVDPTSVSLYGDTSGDTVFVLDHRGQEWFVSFYERGVQRSVEVFPSEDAACRRFAEITLNAGWTTA